MSIKLLHLSDIHFKHYGANEVLDLDSDLRNELEIDLKKLVVDIGTLDIILVGGDIAFSGSVSEYNEAQIWLSKLCKIAGNQEENVLTIPGNHDVDRNKICPILKVVQSNLKSLVERGIIDVKLSGMFNSEESKATLMKTFTNYENFALRYGSIPDRNNGLYWEKDFKIKRNILRIRGINSAIVSNNDDDEHTSKLFLGSVQTQLQRHDGIFYLVLCHHPPQWLYDNDEVDTDLTNRARLQLFGHKHKFNAVQMNQSLRLSAGAVQPPKHEKNWDPRYNIIEIDVEEKTKGEKILVVKIWKRIWNKQNSKFNAESTNGELFERFTLTLDEVEKRDAYAEDETAETQPLINNTPQVDTMENTEMINPQSPNPLRRLAYRFLSLPYHIKISVAVKLELLQDEDQSLNEVQKSKAYLERAQMQNKLAELWDAIAEVNKTTELNPFKS